MIEVNESHDRLRSHNFTELVEKIKHGTTKNTHHHKRKNHYNIFHNHSLIFLINFIATKIMDIKTIKTKQIPKMIKETCHFFKSSKLITKYENIPKNAVKKAKEYVFKKSKYNFIFSIDKIIANENKFNLKGKVCFTSF